MGEALRVSLVGGQLRVTLAPHDACVHDWEYVQDWMGNPGVINGTADCSYRACRVCGKEEPINWEAQR
jgi:hypothetical protein